MPMLSIVHTTFASVEPLNTVAQEALPGVYVMNIVDDDLVRYVQRVGVDARLTRRLFYCFVSAVEAGADVILSACSSVGEAVDVARRAISVPILKIDEPMAEEAVTRGHRIAVVATTKSTLDPTCRLLENKARERQADIVIVRRLCEGAFDLLLAGKLEEHDRVVTDVTLEAAKSNDVVLFAQASMVRLVPTLQKRIDVPLMSSPRPAMSRLQQMLAARAGG